MYFHWSILVVHYIIDNIGYASIIIYDYITYMIASAEIQASEEEDLHASSLI